MKKILLVFITFLVITLSFSFKNNYLETINYNALIYDSDFNQYPANHYYSDFQIENLNKNYLIKYYIDKENYENLGTNTTISFYNIKNEEDETFLYGLTNLKTVDILFKEKDKYYINLKLINWSNNKRILYILQNNKTIQENTYNIELNKDEKITDILFMCNGSISKDNKNVYDNYDNFYISNAYNIDTNLLLSFNVNSDFLGNNLDYRILNNEEYEKNKHLLNNYKVEVSYIDYLDNRKVISYEVITQEDIKKYFIATKIFNNEYTKIKIYVSYNYLLKQEDFNIIKNILYKDKNLRLFLYKDTYNTYLADNYTIGSKYIIETEIQNVENNAAKHINFEIEVINDNVFNNFTKKIIIENTAKKILKVIGSIFIIILVVAAIIIIIKFKRKIIK